MNLSQNEFILIYILIYILRNLSQNGNIHHDKDFLRDI